jgi:hypothetical protein
MNDFFEGVKDSLAELRDLLARECADRPECSIEISIPPENPGALVVSNSAGDVARVTVVNGALRVLQGIEEGGTTHWIGRRRFREGKFSAQSAAEKIVEELVSSE